LAFTGGPPVPREGDLTGTGSHRGVVEDLMPWYAGFALAQTAARRGLAQGGGDGQRQQQGDGRSLAGGDTRATVSKPVFSGG
jgi:hypothetical protein